MYWLLLLKFCGVALRINIETKWKDKCLTIHSVPTESFCLKLGADLKGKTSLPTPINGNKYTYK